MSWAEIKDAVEVYTGLSRDALHIYLAVLVQLVIAGITRRGLRDALPWLLVLVLAFANEWLDVFAEPEAQNWKQSAAVHDVWNTMLLPTLLLLVARFAPGLLTSHRPPAAQAREAER